MKRLFCVLLMAMALPAWGADVMEGEWEVGLVMRVGGQDYGPQYRRQCFTQADAKNPGRLFGEPVGGCEFVKMHYFGSQASFNVRCNAEIPLTGTGQVEFSKESFYGTLNLVAQLPNGPSVDTEAEINGKRLGPCQQ